MRKALLYTLVGLVWWGLAYFEERRGDESWMLISVGIGCLCFYLAWREGRKR
ncbi:MAG TPA: hypothetical protein PKD86_08860 [Gemmatales bacterium]|nr:hypothetical protein [Gemmatales bacterium]